MSMSIDPKIYELAKSFVDDVINEASLTPAGIPRWARRYTDVERLRQRAAEAMQQAIEDECAAIREELLDHRDYADAVDSGNGPVLERDR